MKTTPVEIPFTGIKMAACHGIPMIVVGTVVAVLGFLILATASRLVPPVTLTAIWLEPHQITSAEIRAQIPVMMSKTGSWARLCPSYAVETFFDERGNRLLQSDEHRIDVPNVTGPISHTPRPVLIPSLLAGTPGRYKLHLDDYSACWPWENWWPIYSSSVEAPFEIVGDER